MFNIPGWLRDPGRLHELRNPVSDCDRVRPITLEVTKDRPTVLEGVKAAFRRLLVKAMTSYIPSTSSEDRSVFDLEPSKRK